MDSTPFVKPFGHKRKCNQYYVPVVIHRTVDRNTVEYICSCGRQYFIDISTNPSSFEKEN